MAARKPDADTPFGTTADIADDTAAGKAQESRDLFEAVYIEDQTLENRSHSPAWVEIPYDDPSLRIAHTLYPPRSRRMALDAPVLKLALIAFILGAGAGLFMLARGRVPAPSVSEAPASTPAIEATASATQGTQDPPVVAQPFPADPSSRTETPSRNGLPQISLPETTAPAVPERPLTTSPVPERPATATLTRDRSAAPAATERPAPATRAPNAATTSNRREPPASQSWRALPSAAAPAPEGRARLPADAPAVPAPPPASAPIAPAPAPSAPHPEAQSALAPAPLAAPQAAAAASAAVSPAASASTPAATASVTPAPAAPPAGAEPALAADERGVRGIIERYRAAYSALDVGAVRAVWPKVNARALGRAFDQLATQQVDFSGCEISIAGERASAGCSGNAEYVTKVGSRTPRLEARTWSFELRKTGSQWTIETVESR